MPKKVQITPEVRDVLERSRAEGDILYLPDIELPRGTYQTVNAVLVALGGKWNKTRRGHVFANGFGAQLDEALAAGHAVDTKRTNEQFFTPPEVALLVFDRAQLLPRHHVLEPSAGMGALLSEPLRLGCPVTAIEKDAVLAEGLRPLLCAFHRAGVIEADFLELKPDASLPFDRVLMNPPFSQGADMDHVVHALGFLRGGGVLVAIMSPHWTFGSDKRSIAFRGIVNEHSHDWTPLPEGSFKASGTAVNTGILVVRKGTI